MKRIICILLMLLFVFPSFAQENPFAPYEIAIPDGAVLENGEGSHTFVSGKTRVVTMLIPRVPDTDIESALQRMVFQFDPDAVMKDFIPMAEGYAAVTSRSDDQFGAGVDQLNVLILGPSGDLLILSGYDLDGDEDKVQSLLDALLENLTVNALPLVQTN